MSEQTTAGNSDDRHVAGLNVRARALRVSGFILLVLFGFVIGGAIRAQDINTLEDVYLLLVRWWAPDKIDIVYRDTTPFGQASLKSSANMVPGAGVFDVRMELLDHFYPDSHYRKLSRGVGRLDLKVEYKAKNAETEKWEVLEKIEPCTAMLATRSLIVTAQHCIKGEDNRVYNIRAASLRLGYFSDDAERADSGQPHSKGLRVRIKPVETRPELDYAVFELEPGEFEKASAQFAPVAFSNTPVNKGQDLSVIHHPLGGAMFLTRAKCRIIEYPLDNPSDQERGMFKHSCGTLPATSGAPIFDERSGQVIAIHVRGDRSIDSAAENTGLAIPVSEIAKVTQLSALKLCLGAPGSPPPAAGTDSECGH